MYPALTMNKFSLLLLFLTALHLPSLILASSSFIGPASPPTAPPLGPISPNAHPATSLREAVRRMRLSLDRELLMLARAEAGAPSRVSRQQSAGLEGDADPDDGFTVRANDGEATFEPILPGVSVPPANMFTDAPVPLPDVVPPGSPSGPTDVVPTTDAPTPPDTSEPSVPVPPTDGPTPELPVPPTDGPGPDPPVPATDGPGPDPPVPATDGPGPDPPVPATTGPGPDPPVPATDGPGPDPPVPATDGPGPAPPVPATDGPGPDPPVPATDGPGPKPAPTDPDGPMMPTEGPGDGPVPSLPPVLPVKPSDGPGPTVMPRPLPSGAIPTDGPAVSEGPTATDDDIIMDTMEPTVTPPPGILPPTRPPTIVTVDPTETPGPEIVESPDFGLPPVGIEGDGDLLFPSVEPSADVTEPTADPDLGVGEVDVTISPSPEESGSVCFPADATVEIQGGLVKKMVDVQLGDHVRVGPAQFSQVFMFTHKMADVRYAFVKLQTESGHELKLTKGHYLYVNGAVAAASTVRTGDSVMLADHTVSTVSAVDQVVSRGLFNPQTVHGDIIVNGVRATTYTTAIERTMAHALLAPLRAAYSSIGWTLSAFDAGNDRLANLVPSGSLLL